MNQTWAELLNLVLRDAGVAAQGQTPNAQMINDAKTRANMMINQWKRNRWLVYHLVETSCPCDQSLFYNVGPGEVLNIPRPDQIQAAFARQVSVPVPNRVDYPLRMIASYEDYSRIALKSLQAGPAWGFFYDSGYPVGKIYPYPLMSSQYELHIITKADLATVDVITDEIMFPPEYEEAIYANSLWRTRMAFQLPEDPAVDRLARATLSTLKSTNFQPATLMMPSSLTPIGGSGYNIQSDSFGPGNR